MAAGSFCFTLRVFLRKAYIVHTLCCCGVVVVVTLHVYFLENTTEGIGKKGDWHRRQSTSERELESPGSKSFATY